MPINRTSDFPSNDFPVLSPSIIYNNLNALFMYLPHRYAYLTTKQDEKEKKIAIYPFHVDYSSLRQKK